MMGSCCSIDNRVGDGEVTVAYSNTSGNYGGTAHRASVTVPQPAIVTEQPGATDKEPIDWSGDEDEGDDGVTLFTYHAKFLLTTFGFIILFSDYSTKTHTLPNLMFYLEIQKFKAARYSMKTEMGRELVQRFVQPRHKPKDRTERQLIVAPWTADEGVEQPQFVNLSDEEARRLYALENFATDSFKETEEALLKLMDDTLAHMRKTLPYKRFIRNMEADKKEKETRM